MHHARTARRLVDDLVRLLDDMAHHGRAFDNSLRPLDEVSAALHDLANEITESRRRLKEIADQIDPNSEPTA